MVNMGDVWDRTTEFLSGNARTLLPIALLALLIPHAVNALVGLAGKAVNPLAGTAIGLICTLIALWGQIAVIALALDPPGGRSRASAAATAAFGRAVAAMLLVFAVVLVLALPILGTLIAGGVDAAALQNGKALAGLSSGARTFVSIYAIALAVLVFFAAIRLALLYPVIVAEGGIVTAIRRAVALTRGIVWKLIGVWLLFGLVYLVASAAVTSAVGAVIGLVFGPPAPLGFGNWVIAVLSGLVATALTLVIGAFSAKLYRAVTAPREGVATA